MRRVFSYFLISFKNLTFSLIMHHFEYHMKSEDILSQAKQDYPMLLGLTDESIEARYYLLHYLDVRYWYHGELMKESTWKPIPIQIGDQNVFWSLSHTENYVAYIVADGPTWIDIAEYREREILLLDIHTPYEYTLLGGKDWHNFYLLWTAKESIIKWYGTKLDDMSLIRLKCKQKSWVYLFEFQSKIHRISSIVQDSMILSIIS